MTLIKNKLLDRIDYLVSLSLQTKQNDIFFLPYSAETIRSAKCISNIITDINVNLNFEILNTQMGSFTFSAECSDYFYSIRINHYGSIIFSKINKITKKTFSKIFYSLPDYYILSDFIKNSYI